MSKSSNPEKVRPGMGEYAFQPVVGAFEPTLQDMLSTEPLMGMNPEGLYLWGTLRDEDGNMFSPMRRIPFDLPGAKQDTRRYFYLQHNVGEQNFILDKAGRNSAPNDNHFFGREGDKAVWRSSPEVSGSPFLAEWWPEGCRWIEEEVMDIKGSLVKPGLQWYIPSRSCAMSYLGCIMEMEGVIKDRKVKGMIGFDVIYMYAGGECHVTKDPLVQENLELCWYTWATRYKDGSIDAGHFMIGNNMLGFAILTDENGNVRFSYDVDCEVSFDNDGYWQTGIKTSLFGEEYEFSPDPRGRMPGLGPIPNPQVEGIWRRKGDDREPDVWFAWGEIAPEHGLEYAPRFKGMK